MVPLVFWYLIQMILAMRWRWSFATIETEKLIKAHGKHIASTEGLPIQEQRDLVLKLSRRYCIHPFSIYQFRLYRDPNGALDYIFPHEAVQLHRLKNGPIRTPDHSALQDKLEFSTRAKKVGLPSVDTVHLLEQHQNVNPFELEIADQEAVFLKTRTGYRGKGAFSLHKREDQLIGYKLEDGKTLAAPGQIKAALDNMLSSDDVIVQPLLKNHSVFEKISPPNQAVILRVVTLRNSDQASICSAYLRVPVNQQLDVTEFPSARKSEVLAKVDIATGEISRNPSSSLNLDPKMSKTEDWLFSILGGTEIVPFWEEISRGSLIGQREFSSLWGIGWDWMITQKQPYLLEGNVFWGVQKLQEVSGGLVSSILWPGRK